MEVNRNVVPKWLVKSPCQLQNEVLTPFKLLNKPQRIPGVPYQSGLLQIRYHVPRIMRKQAHRPIERAYPFLIFRSLSLNYLDFEDRLTLYCRIESVSKWYLVGPGTAEMQSSERQAKTIVKFMADKMASGICLYTKYLLTLSTL